MATTAELGTLPLYNPHKIFQGSVGGRRSTNPPFAPDLYSTNPHYANLQQGFLISDPGTTDAQLNFMYNPSDFQESWQASAAILPPSDLTSADSASLVGAIPATCTFSILFDRTYEVNYPLGSGMPYPSHASGVNVDIDALKRLVGITDGQGNSSLMQIVPMTLYLGNVNSTIWHGYCTSITIAYSHYSTNMVPMRAAVSLNMTLVLSPAGGTATASNPAGLPAGTNFGGLSNPLAGAAPRAGAAPGTRARAI